MWHIIRHGWTAQEATTLATSHRHQTSAKVKPGSRFFDAKTRLRKTLDSWNLMGLAVRGTVGCVDSNKARDYLLTHSSNNLLVGTC
jgi:hypothetical protein